MRQKRRRSSFEEQDGRVDRSYNNKGVEFESTVAGPPVHPWRCGTGAGVRQGCCALNCTYCAVRWYLFISVCQPWWPSTWVPWYLALFNVRDILADSLLRFYFGPDILGSNTGLYCINPPACCPVHVCRSIFKTAYCGDSHPSMASPTLEQRC